MCACVFCLCLHVFYCGIRQVERITNRWAVGGEWCGRPANSWWSYGQRSGDKEKWGQDVCYNQQPAWIRTTAYIYLKYGQHLLAVPQECTGSNFTLEQLWTHVSVSTSPGAQIKWFKAIWFYSASRTFLHFLNRYILLKVSPFTLDLLILWISSGDVLKGQYYPFSRQFWSIIK